MKIKTNGVLVVILCIVNYIYPMEDEYLSQEVIFADMSADCIGTSDDTIAQQLQGAQELLMLRDSEDKQFLGKNVAGVNDKDEDDRAPLHKAVQECSVELIQQLLSLNAQVDVQDAYLRTPLHYAVEISDKDLALKIIEILVANGASVLIEDVFDKIPGEYTSNAEVKTFLARCADKELLAKCSVEDNDIVCPKPSRGSQDYYMIKRLLADQVIPWPKKPLYLEDVEYIKKQLLSGAVNVTSTDEDGKTLLHHLMIEGKASRQLINAFIDRGGNINTQDNQGRTALFYGVLHQRRTVHNLLVRGADPSIPDLSGIVPYNMGHDQYFRTMFARWRAANQKLQLSRGSSLR
jgi:ankyrin repeat protein